MTKSELKDIINECLYEYNMKYIVEDIESINISPEDISKILNDNVDYDLLYESVNLDKYKNLYTKLGLDANIVKNNIIDSGKKIYSIIRKEGINDKSRAKISTVVIDLYNNIAKLLSPRFEFLDFGKYDANKISNALILVCFNICINDLSEFIFSLLFGRIAGIFISTAIVGPISEEFAKYASIKGGFEKEYFIVFNALEVGLYTTQMIKNKVPITKALFYRSKGVVFHLTNTIIQWIFNNPKVQKKLNIDPTNEDDKKKASFIGVLSTTLLHSFYNGVCVINAINNR